MSIENKKVHWQINSSSIYSKDVKNFKITSVHNNTQNNTYDHTSIFPCFSNASTTTAIDVFSGKPLKDNTLHDTPMSLICTLIQRQNPFLTNCLSGEC